jgi:hypothetical protein
MIDRLEEEDDS